MMSNTPVDPWDEIIRDLSTTAPVSVGPIPTTRKELPREVARIEKLLLKESFRTMSPVYPPLMQFAVSMAEETGIRPPRPGFLRVYLLNAMADGLIDPEQVMAVIALVAPELLEEQGDGSS